MEWKNTVVKYYALKQRRLTFKGNLHDFAYISDKKSVGIITEILGENLFNIAFFPSMLNDKTFTAIVNFNRAKDFIIPRYESLLKFAGFVLHERIDLERTVDLKESRFISPLENKAILLEKLAEFYKKCSRDMSEYDLILNFICDCLGMGNIFSNC